MSMSRLHGQAKTLTILPLVAALMIIVLLSSPYVGGIIERSALQWAIYPRNILVTIAFSTLVLWPFFIGALAAWVLKSTWWKVYLALQIAALVLLPSLARYSRPELSDYTGVMFLALGLSFTGFLMYLLLRPTRWLREAKKAIEATKKESPRGMVGVGLFLLTGMGTLIELLILYLFFGLFLCELLEQLPAWVRAVLSALGLIGILDVTVIIALLRQAEWAEAVSNRR